MATNTNSRIWSVFTGTVHSAPSNYTAYGPSNRLIRANQQAESNVYSGLTDSFWINGIDENRDGFAWHIAYLICDDQGNPQLSTTTGTQSTPPPDNVENPQLEENNAYIRFKAGSGNDAFVAAIQHIKDLNEAAGNVLNNGSMPEDKAGASTWKTWADSNLDYYTNFTVAATTTTMPSYAGSIWAITNEGEDPILYKYYPLQQEDVDNPVSASAGSPIGAGQQRNICSLASTETAVDVTPFVEGQVPVWTVEETETSCNGGDTSY